MRTHRSGGDRRERRERRLATDRRGMMVAVAIDRRTGDRRATADRRAIYDRRAVPDRRNAHKTLLA